MHRSRILIGLLLLAACKPVGDNPVPGKAEELAGNWNLVVHRSGYDDITAAVRLTPTDSGDTKVPAALQGGTLEGRFAIRSHAWLPAPPRDSSASAFLSEDSAVVLYLRLNGSCANCGNLGFAGHLAGDSITGHWRQELPGSSPPDGRFVLQRVRQH